MFEHANFGTYGDVRAYYRDINIYTQKKGKPPKKPKKRCGCCRAAIKSLLPFFIVVEAQLYHGKTPLSKKAFTQPIFYGNNGSLGQDLSFHRWVTKK